MDELSEDVALLHEYVLEENEEDVKELLRTLADEKAHIHNVLTREMRLDNDPEWAMSAIHRTAAVGNTAILSLLLGAAPDIDINLPVTHQGLTPLHLAAAEGHTPMVNYLTSNGALVNSMDKYGRTALHLAAEEGHRDVAQILGVKSADSNIKDGRGLTPLHLAASKGHAKMVSYLLKKSEADTVDEVGQTALHKAMATGALDVCEVLLSQEVNTNIQDGKGNTALHLAIQGFNNTCRSNGVAETMSQEVARKTIIDAALNAGSDVNIQNEAGDTALHVAVSADVLDVVKVLLDRKAKVNMLNRRGCSPLFYGRNSMSVRLLSEHGAVIMARDNWKNTALHEFVGNNDIHSDIIDVMVEMGCDVNAKNVEERTPLYRACESGHLEKVKKLLKYRGKHDILDRSKKSLLHACLQVRSREVAYFLVDKVGVNVQSSDENGVFPLHLAVESGDLGLVDLLIRRGAGVNVSDRKTTTPASLALLHAHYDILRLLIQHGAKVDDNTGGCEAPLNLFAKCDDVINVCRLLDQGLDINKCDSRGRTALHDAIAARAYNVCRELLGRGANAMTTDRTGETPLHRAAYVCDDYNIITELLDNGANINQKNMNDETALHISVRNSRVRKILNTLVERGADVLAFDKVGSCPLHCVINESETDVQCRDNLVCLLMEGIDLDTCNSEGKVILHMASKRGFTSSCHLILEYGATVDLKDREGRTALHHACMLDQHDVANVLIKARASTDVLDHTGASPLVYAVKSSVFETVELLLGQGADCGLVANGCQYPLHEALVSSNTDLIELFLMNEVDVSYVDSKRRTVLHLAASSAVASVIDMMINMKADVRAVDSHGNTPLHLAARNRDVGITKLLLANGAHVNAQNKDGNTPLHMGCLYASYNHVNLLLEKGADFTICNTVGETALHHAAKSDDQDALELLVSNDADVNVLDQRGQTPFLVALSHDNYEAAMILADQGSDLYHVDNDGQSALHKVSVMRKPPSSMISFLYQRGLSPDLPDNYGRTPLQLANQQTLHLLTKLRI